jgi:hypothetical protein
VLQVWNINTGELIKTMQPADQKPPHLILGLTKLTDNKVVAVGNDRNVNLYF